MILMSDKDANDYPYDPQGSLMILIILPNGLGEFTEILFLCKFFLEDFCENC